MQPVDVVIVSYNSGNELAKAVTGLSSRSDVNVIVVDNASKDDSLAVAARLNVSTVALSENGGFAKGCNAGWREGSAPYVLLLNPDASLAPGALERMVADLDEDPKLGAVGPKIMHTDGLLDYSQRRFPRLRSTYAQALFLHRVFPQASWTNEVVRNHEEYERTASPDWLSGACILLRRGALEQLDGLDERFFMYAEDVDLCCRLRKLGYELRYEPDAVAIHDGGASAPRPALLPVLAESRIRYAQKHGGRVHSGLERAGVALGALTHAILTTEGSAGRRGYGLAFAGPSSAASRSVSRASGRTAVVPGRPGG